MRRGWWLVTAGAMTVLAPASVQARPEYAEREKKPCAFCHVDPNGGGARNERGKYYASHDKSLKGLPAAFLPLWKVEAPPGARRVAIGDVLGDGKPRALLLDETEELAVLDVKGDKAEKESGIKLGPQAPKFVVGVFQKGKPAMIVMPGVVIARQGDAWTQKKASDLTVITGTVRFAEGEECVFHFDGFSEPAVFGVDLAAANPLTVGPTMVMPDQGAGIYRSITARMDTAATAALGWPEEAQKGGVFGLWDPRGDDNLRAWTPWTAKDGNYLIMVDPSAVMSGGDMRPTWKSEKLAGKIVDVAVGADPRGGKAPGFLLLLATGEDGKGRTLQFLALD